MAVTDVSEEHRLILTDEDESRTKQAQAASWDFESIHFLLSSVYSFFYPLPASTQA
jgi:hypothetical protein